MGPAYHQIRPKSQPQATPMPTLEDSLRKRTAVKHAEHDADEDVGE